MKLFDFGIVKAEGRVTKTQHGVVKGNVSFMSPEQARGTNVDGRADLFSLGLVIFYCLTGEVLYRGKTTYELLVKAATGPGTRRAGAHRRPARALRRDRRQGAGGRSGQALPERRRVRRRAGAAHRRAARRPAAAMMAALFADDFRAEEARFAAALPQGERATGGRRDRRPESADVSAPPDRLAPPRRPRDRRC